MNDSTPTASPTRAELARRLRAYAELQARIRRQTAQLNALRQLAQTEATAICLAASALQPTPPIVLPEAALTPQTHTTWLGLSQAALATLHAKAPAAAEVRYLPRKRALGRLWATPAGKRLLASVGVSPQEEAHYRIQLSERKSVPQPPPAPVQASRQPRRRQAARNRALLARFRALHSQQDLGMEATLRQLAREFYLSERTVQRVLRGSYKRDA